MPKEEARKKLMELPEIDKKTVDDLLAQRHSYAEVMVVDTHFERTAKKLGLVKSDAKYEDTQKVLKTFTPWERGKEQQACCGFWQSTLQSIEPEMPRMPNHRIMRLQEQRQKETRRQRQHKTRKPRMKA